MDKQEMLEQFLINEAKVTMKEIKEAYADEYKYDKENRIIPLKYLDWLLITAEANGYKEAE
jgi:hypothetical protein